MADEETPAIGLKVGLGRIHDRSLTRLIVIRSTTAIVGVAIVTLAALILRDPLASMSDYTAALMALNQIAPPLLLLAVSWRRTPGGGSFRSGLMRTIFDPWSATLLFILLSVAISLPGIFDPTLTNALYAGPLGAVELLVGLLFWAQILPATRSIRRGWVAGLLAWLGSIPMMVVAVVWMLSADVLYTPYLDVICIWNVPPLVDQKWAGLVMFVAGVPLQLVGTWLLLDIGGCDGLVEPSAGRVGSSAPATESA